MLHFKILKKFLIPSSAMIGVAADDDPAGRICDPKQGLVKPSELPIYVEEEECKPVPIEVSPCAEDGTASSSSSSSSLEETVSLVRRELWVWFDQYKGYRQKVVDVVQTGKDHTEATLDYLKEESNYLPRVGAISLGGVAGLVFGLRGGMTRRLFYATTGSLAMAVLCYPRHASNISSEALSYAKKGVAITYNFIHGVKPEGLKLPPLPQTLMDMQSEPPPEKSKFAIGLPPVPDKQEEENDEQANTMKTDQSNPSDKDLYTTRS